MDRLKWPALSGYVIGTFVLTRNIPTTFILDRPIHSSIFVLAISGAAVLVLSRFLPTDAGRSHHAQQHELVPLHEVGHSSRPSSPTQKDVTYPSSLRKLRITFVTLVSAILLRVAVLREVMNNIQCSALTWEPLIPFALAVGDFWTVQRKKRRTVKENDDDSVYDALGRRITNSPYLYMLATLLVGAGSMVALAYTSAPFSTYICAASLSYQWSIPLLQRLATLLDFVILSCVARLLAQENARGARSVTLRFASTAWALLFSAFLLCTFGALYYFFQVDDRFWIAKIPRFYVWSVLGMSFYLTLTLICALVAIFHVGIMTTTLLATFVAVTTLTTEYAWQGRHPFPPSSPIYQVLGSCMVAVGFIVYMQTNTRLSRSDNGIENCAKRTRAPILLYLLALFPTLLWIGHFPSHKGIVSYHPIEWLMYDAQTAHLDYVNQSSVSKTLIEATQQYQKRYNRTPPPNFDAWYEFATDRRSVIIDDFDSIEKDILPFFTLPPLTIRARTWDMISNPWNDVAGVSIRSGKAQVTPGAPGTHQWMLDGVVQMLDKFSKWLPDMDLAFNLNDEPRVVVPYERDVVRQGHKLEASRHKGRVKKFSEGRAEQWPPIPEDPHMDGPMEHMSFQRTFHGFASASCPRGSPARQARTWDRSKLCISCTAPQSLGGFLGNWSIAADICHQPDLADLHGLYTSPAAFKGTHFLYPIFSQSKAHGFNDILYPSAWNYLDKVKYEPSKDFPDDKFKYKNGTLFWRGATSEGVSPGGGQWRGMTRQRLVHLANNVNDSAPPQTLLLPEPFAKSGKLQYVKVPVSNLQDLLFTDAHFVNEIVRCGGRDCPVQATEFAPLVPPIDFQSHWQYKYLLDVDGAGFSGRFLSFLQSGSLPFKAALFREWWNDRVMPWAHYVPLDIRGHGMWATLAYFEGVDGDVNGKNVTVPGRRRDAERLAEQGSEWAKKVLRKEDMEIYLFRLLLEWGRLTDDRRDELGLFLG